MSPDRYARRRSLPEIGLWGKMKARGAAMSFDLEATARCNLDCRHCYINRPAGDRRARAAEMTVAEIERLGAEAAGLGAIWCLVTGGDPLLRKDFPDLYIALKRQGLLLSVYTNATLVRREHVALFRAYPPRDIEVTVYGATRETYERVTRTPGSFEAFRRGLALLEDGGVPVRLKAMALRSNVHDLPAIREFARRRTKDYFRFDPFLHFRFDRDPARNRDIAAERLSPAEIVAVEEEDAERIGALRRACDSLLVPEPDAEVRDRVFKCGAGRRNFVIGYDATFRLCVSLHAGPCVYDLRRGSLADAWQRFVPLVLEKRSTRPEFLDRCGRCRIVNLCPWCPANAELELGALDLPIEYFCRIAHARAEALKAG